MDDESRALDKGWDALPGYSGAGDADEAVTVSVSTAPGEWLVNTVDSVVVPMSMVEVVEALRAHKLTDRSLVWRTGMQEWQPVERVPQLKLAARMSSTPSVAPLRAATPSRPPTPKSSRGTTAPQGTPSQSVAPLPMPSRKATLPGLPPPSKSRPSHPRLSAARSAAPPPASSDESDVLAVYARPAATISFELAPEPAPQSAPPVLHAPQTLAPTTTDTQPRRPPPARNADLSVVAASQFREVQRSSKRLIWVSSLGSAAAASLLTLWLSSSPSSNHGAAGAPALPVQTLASKPAPPPTIAAPDPAPTLAAAEATPAPAPAEVASAKPKPKAKRRPKAVVARPLAPAVAADAAPATPQDEPNPYDVKLEEDPPAPAKAAPSEGSGLEATSATSDTKPTRDSGLPGF
jgi:hypothetical protein